MDETLRQFISEHAGDDCGRLLLGRAKWPHIDMRTAVNCIESRRKLRSKLPQWYEHDELLYPNTISAEQCSGEFATRYKLEIITETEYCTTGGRRQYCGTDSRFKGMSIADLTGGLGVDSATFAAAGARVLYNEMDRLIYEAAEHNFHVLGVEAVCRNMELRADNIDEVLGGFKPDIVFLDPSRRSDSGSKVFRLEDCSPDLTGLVKPLMERVPRIIVKLSPMADITLLCRQMEEAAGRPCVQAVHVVGSGGECKELVLDLRRSMDAQAEADSAEDAPAKAEDAPAKAAEASGKAEPLIIVAVDGARMSFRPQEEKNAVVKLCDSPAGMVESILAEPCSTLMKAAPFRLICNYGMKKAGLSTQLYFTENQSADLKGLCKFFRVLEVLPLDKRSIKAVGLKYPHAEVSARNIPMDSDSLRKRLGVKSGDGIHIFGIRCDFSAAPSGNYLVVAARRD